MLMGLFIDRLDDDGTEVIDTVAAASLAVTSAAVETMNSTSAVTTSTIVSEAANHPTITKSTTLSNMSMEIRRPIGNRWAVAAANVDISGDWELIVTDDFRKEYDQYLEGLGQPKIVRSVALGIIGQTTETTVQTDQGRSLLIVGKNIRGVWTRTLVSSGTDNATDTFTSLKVPITSADSELVGAEAWWEDRGRVHVSWMRGVTKYGGGSFESRRYLEDNRNVYVCESVFYPNDTTKVPNKITWRFRRQGRTF